MLLLAEAPGKPNEEAAGSPKISRLLGDHRPIGRHSVSRSGHRIGSHVALIWEIGILITTFLVLVMGKSNVMKHTAT